MKDDDEEINKELDENSNFFVKEAYSHYVFESGFRACKYCNAECKYRKENTRCQLERIVYHSVMVQLREDIEKIGLEFDFSTSTLMGEVAMTLVRIMRLNGYVCCNDMYIKEFNYESKISPVCEYEIRLQNHLNKLMSKLGIMPLQILNRKNTKIAESIEMELSKLQTETLETKSTGAKLKLKGKKKLEKPIEN